MPTPRSAAVTIKEQNRIVAMNMISIGDWFTDPMDGEERQVAHKGMLIMGNKSELPYWDDSVFCTDGGCADPVEVWDNLVL